MPRDTILPIKICSNNSRKFTLGEAGLSGVNPEKFANYTKINTSITVAWKARGSETVLPL